MKSSLRIQWKCKQQKRDANWRWQCSTHNEKRQQRKTKWSICFFFSCACDHLLLSPFRAYEIYELNFFFSCELAEKNLVPKQCFILVDLGGSAVYNHCSRMCGDLGLLDFSVFFFFSGDSFCCHSLSRPVGMVKRALWHSIRHELMMNRCDACDTHSHNSNFSLRLWYLFFDSIAQSRATFSRCHFVVFHLWSVFISFLFDLFCNNLVFLIFISLVLCTRWQNFIHDKWITRMI